MTPAPLALPHAEVQTFIVQNPLWSLEKGALSCTFELATFPKAIEFVGKVAAIAEAANHHPDIDIRWRKITLAFITHDAGNAITRLDTRLARECQIIAATMA